MRRLRSADHGARLGRRHDVKSDRTREWIALGQSAADERNAPHDRSADDSRSVPQRACVAPVVQLVWATRPRVFAISGPAGAGKSTVSSAVSRSLADLGMRAIALSMDDFYLPRKERERRGIAWRAAPGSHDIGLMVDTLAAIHSGSGPLALPRFDFSMDDRGSDERLDDVPDVVLFDGWIIGYDGDGYGRILPYLDWHLHLDVPIDVARDRRFGRETRLRDETGRALTPEEMQQFWDEVLGPGMDTWVRAAAEHADIVVRLTPTGCSCLAEPRLDELLGVRSDEAMRLIRQAE